MMDRIKVWWKSEATRHFLWVPVGFATGIALYYAWPVEPAAWLFPALTLLAFAALLIWRRRAFVPLFAIFLILFGAAYANVRTLQHFPLMLEESLSPRPVIGVVKDIERTERGVRILLTHVTVEDLPAEKTPEQIRLTVRFKKGAAFELPNIGDSISIRAGLMPAMGPALPGGFDFARYFYFRDIGAIGYGLPPWKLLGHNASPSLANRFWTWRTQVTDRIVDQLGPEIGGVAAGLITGDAKAISEADFEALRASNLYHIIAISGEHMAVMAGVIFVSLRLLLLLLPARFALRPEGKSVTAAVTLLLVTIYLFVTGLPMSAVRAYIMIALVLFAIIVRRQVDAMRSLAITALLILLYDPASLLDPGFQLSFAATLALIALIDMRLLKPLPGVERGRVRRVLRLFATMVLVSVVAEAATAPLVINMFNNVSPYGVFANTLATPLVSLFLMPVVALYFILLPLGFEAFALSLMQHGIGALLALARWVADFPYAQIFAPSLPALGLALFVFSLLWVCLWHTRARRYGLVPALLGVLSVFTVTPPDMLMGGTLKQIAFRDGGDHVLARGRADSMIPELWAHGLGKQALEKADQPDWRCDKLGCVATVNGLKIAFPGDGAASVEDCSHAQIIVSLEPLACDHALTIGPKQLRGSGVAALWLTGGKPRFETSADWQGTRPWSVGTVDEAE